MINFVTSNLLWTCGWPIALFLGLLFVLSIIYKRLFFIFIPFFLFSFYFFRNPTRICKQALTDDSILICPSDGKVLDVQKGDFQGYKQKVSIFLSPLDVHVNWIPFSGIAQEINYTPGKFLMAFEPKSSELNESNEITILSSGSGYKILVKQIAGFIARRICCWIKKDEQVQAGQKYGMIRFGSRIEIFLPDNVEIYLHSDQRVWGGETVLGRFR